MEEAIKNFALVDGKEVNDVVASLAQKCFRDVSPDFKSLTKEMSKRFHSVAETLL